MALDPQLINVTKEIIKEFKLNKEFENIFLKYLESESKFQCGDEERLEVISLLKNELTKK